MVVTLTNEITSRNWSLSIFNAGAVVQGVEDIAQCIQIICTTQKRSDPLRPDFGIDLNSYVDLPVNTVLPGLLNEMVTQIGRYEPRASINSIVPTISENSILNIKVVFSVGQQQSSTEFETIRLAA